jgi:hypothetical protein
MRRGSSYAPPKSIDEPRRAKISEKRAVSPWTTRSQLTSGTGEHKHAVGWVGGNLAKGCQ